MAIEFILEIGILTFALFLIVALIVACIVTFGAVVDAFQHRNTENFIFSALGLFFLLSVFLMLVGTLVFLATT